MCLAQNMHQASFANSQVLLCKCFQCPFLGGITPIDWDTGCVFFRVLFWPKIKFLGLFYSF